MGTQERIDIGYFEETLTAYLEDNMMEQAGDAEFIKTRSGLAEEAFEKVCLEGNSAMEALEESRQVLFAGLGKSFNALIAEILEEEFPTLVGYSEKVIADIARDSRLTSMKEAFYEYDDTADSFGDRLLYYQTVGTVEEILKENGYIQ